MKYVFVAVCYAYLGTITGCVMSGVSNVDQDPNFSWDAMKRDQILMTPLIDLRRSKDAPAGHAHELDFFADKEREEYAERFKQAFFSLRKDIRVFGAGGAFESTTRIPNLTEIARTVVDKNPVAEKDRALILQGSQDIRYLFFFTITDEKLSYDLAYRYREEAETDLLIYTADRRTTVRLALWDSQENKTVWIGTEQLTPSNQNTVEVRNPTKRREKRKANNQQGYKYVWIGRPMSFSLSSERERNPGRFPEFPGREPQFSATFDDFALSLPLHPSEAKLIEYSSFTYHRPEARIVVTELGEAAVGGLHLGTSSIINNRWRLGGLIYSQFESARKAPSGEKFAIDAFGFGASFDAEWAPTEATRVLAGVSLGTCVFTLRPESPQSESRIGTARSEGDQNESSEDEKSLGDATVFAWPRVGLLFGARAGMQVTTGLSYRYFKGVDEAALKANRPGTVGIDAGIAYAFRGF